jgi:enoyl-[acyl-carrier protein] reductase II
VPPTNRICALAGVDIPIIQAPMTFIAGAQLAAAVSSAGGLGIIETASPQGRADLARVRDLTDKPVGANIALMMMRDPAVVDVLVDNGIRFVTTSAGNPTLFTERLQDAGITVFHVVGTLASARKAADAGVDGLVVEGVEGGGFKNRYGASSMVLLPLVAAEVDLPIVAAGGICDARSMAAAFVLGAEGVQMGTRLLASADSPVHGNFKQAVVDADETGTVLLPMAGVLRSADDAARNEPLRRRENVQMMRVIRTDAAEAIDASGEATALGAGGLERIRELYFDGDMAAGVANTGQVAGRIGEIKPAAEIIAEMWAGCRDALGAAAARL